ncbi:GNAT family N-acetyltransferase [Microvirga sp. TS319]|uniref:GNAT family N-acetyltransferase n=1 Tax=Microvirga sp. TS319 TaxID=3241165 RepID=UPI00351AA6FB
MTVELVSLRERPDLLGKADELVASLWPTFVLKDPVAGRYWPKLSSPSLAPFQALAVETGSGTQTVVAFANAVPFALDRDGDPATMLPDDGWDGVLRDGVELMLRGEQANALSALAITVHPAQRGSGLAERLIGAMKQAALTAGLSTLVAPIRPTRKALYPLQSFDEYCAWTRADGLPFDPWIRTHSRLGARIVKVALRSMTVSGTVASWEAWTGLRFPATGCYAVPDALAPVRIDRAANTGTYVEPNLWMKHPLSG